MNQDEWDEAGKLWWNSISVERRKHMLTHSSVWEIDPVKWHTPAGSGARCYEVFGQPHPDTKSEIENPK